MDASYFPKKKFFGKVDQHWFGPTIVSHHATSFQKNPHRADHENKVAWFLPELPLVQKGIFLENWLTWLMSNYCTTHARMFLKISGTVNVI